MSNGSLNHDEPVKQAAAADNPPESSVADNEATGMNGMPAQPGTAPCGSTGKNQKPGVNSSLPETLRGKLELYAKENAAGALNRKRLAFFYMNKLTPDERRFIAGDYYDRPDEHMNRISDKLKSLLIEEQLCSVTGMENFINKIRSVIYGTAGAAEKNIHQADDITDEMEKLIFPLAVRVEDMIIQGNEIPWHNRNLPELKDFSDRGGSIMLGEHVLASGKIIAGDDDSSAFVVTGTSLDGKGKETPMLTELLLDYPLDLSVEIGRKYPAIDEAGSIGPGTIIRFDRLASEPVDLVLEDSDMVIARGEVVALDDYFGIRITDYVCGGISGIMSGNKSRRERRIDDVLRVPLRCVLGRRKLRLKDFSGLGEGSIIELDSTVFSPVEVLVGGDIILRGEVVVVEDYFGVRVVDENRGSPLRVKEYEETGGDNESTGDTGEDDTSGDKKPFVFLEGVDPGHLAGFLQGEHPQVIALVLSFLSPSLCAAVISNLPPRIQGDAARGIAGMKTVSSDVISDMEKVLKRKVSILASADFPAPGGIDAVVEVLNMTDRGTEKTIIESLEENDPELAEEIKKRLFVFEDIALLDDRCVQKILREVDTQDLAKSLKGVSAEVRELIFRNMSKRASTMVCEDMHFMGPVRLRDVEESQQKIINIIRKLEDAGEIIIARPGEDKLVV